MRSSPVNFQRRPWAALAGIGLGTALVLASAAKAGTLGVLPVEQAPAPNQSATVPDAPASTGNAPTSIVPPSDQPASAPLPNAAPTEPQIRTIQARPGDGGSSIEIGTLDSAGGSASGVAAPAMPGAPGMAPAPSYSNTSSSLWGSTPREVIERNLPKLPVGTGSPVVNDLTRQVLLTSASPNETAGGAPSLLPVRLERLMAAGRPDWAAQLAGDPTAGVSPTVVMWRARAQLAAGDDKGACASESALPANGDPATDQDAAFAMKLNVFCQIADGKKEAAIMTTDLAREEGLDDPLFYSLAAQASDGISLKASDPASIDALHAAFYRLAGRALPANAVEIAEPALVASLSKDAKQPVDVRIAAGERAAKLGAINGSELASLYQLATFTQADFDGLKTASFPPQAAMRRALLYHAIKKETDPSQRIYLFKLALATGDSAGLSVALADALKPDLASAPLTPAYKPLGPVAIRTFLLLDDRMDAERWYGFVGAQNSMFGRDARELTALMQINDKTRASWDQDTIIREIASDLSSGMATSVEFSRAQTVILTALGMRMEPAILAAVPDANDIAGNVAPLDPLLADLHAAAQRRAVGETLMLSLVALGERGPATTSIRAVGEVIVALRAIGFEDDARRIATEALLARASAGRG